MVHNKDLPISVNYSSLTTLSTYFDLSSNSDILACFEHTKLVLVLGSLHAYSFLKLRSSTTSLLRPSLSTVSEYYFTELSITLPHLFIFHGIDNYMLNIFLLLLISAYPNRMRVTVLALWLITVSLAFRNSACHII